MEPVERQEKAFFKANAKLIERSGRALAGEWLKVTSPDMYKEYLDLTPLLENHAPVHIDENDGKRYFDLRGIDLGLGVVGMIFEHVDFSYSTGLTTMHCKLKGCLFQNCDLINNYMGLYYKDCRLINVVFPTFGTFFLEDCTLERCKCEKSTSHRFKITRCNILNTSFRKAGILEWYISDSVFQECSFRQAMMDTSQYINVRFVKCDFKNTYDGFIPPGVEE